MLAESFLTIFAYKGDPFGSRQGQLLKPVGQENWQSQFENRDEKEQFFVESKQAPAEKMPEIRGGNIDPKSHQQIPGQDAPRNKTHKIPQSVPQRIPVQDQYCCGKQLDLYRSWSCQSLYQNYPDLHIGGDHVADHTGDSDPIVDQTSNESSGPVFLSTDLPLDNPFPLQKSRALKLGHGDDAGENSLALRKERLSNSLLNKHMEKEIQELYKQFWEEKLTHCNSITHCLMSNGLMSNLGEAHHHPLPHGHHQQTLLHSLARLGLHNSSGGNSSEISTPNLQISAPLSKRKCL
ncbi:TLR adapter interacting with SLC15A4 on the lysosome-like [Erythrolamprus reginae]|uniref:TLR adapter interacting with SLC15A4 on the lysosome-like n=1 Tax=Erythrolamprus reginae TaxID=121349 RepID=UPI00396CC26C